MTVFSSREFNRDVTRAKKAAGAWPVFITVRGRPAHLLLTIEAYQRLTGDGPSIVDLLGGPDAADGEFDPPRLGGPLFRAADLE